MTEENRQHSFTPLVAQFIATRIVINTAYRVVYPFLGAFATGLGVSLQTASLALTSRSLVGAFGPLLAPIADRYGRKAGMLFGLTLFCLGIGVVAAWPTFPAFMIALALAATGNQVFLPAMQAYLGDRIPYARRGSVLALTELSWSLSGILLVPLLGLLIARLGWQAPFWLLAVLGILALIGIAWRVPADRPHPSETQRAVWHSLKQVLASRSAWIALSFSFTITLANEVVNLVFGVWMNDVFGLQIAALGLAATVIGFAELSGEFATVTLVDRIGKKRSVRIGLIVTSLAALALPILGRSMAGALVGLFLFYLGFEFTLVSYIPVMTEVLPGARATIMASSLAATSLGRAGGALIGAWLYSLGFSTNAMVALALNGLAILILSRVPIDDE